MLSQAGPSFDHQNRSISEQSDTHLSFASSLFQNGSIFSVQKYLGRAKQQASSNTSYFLSLCWTYINSTVAEKTKLLGLFLVPNPFLYIASMKGKAVFAICHHTSKKMLMSLKVIDSGKIFPYWLTRTDSHELWNRGPQSQKPAKSQTEFALHALLLLPDFNSMPSSHTNNFKIFLNFSLDNWTSKKYL